MSSIVRVCMPCAGNPTLPLCVCIYLSAARNNLKLLQMSVLSIYSSGLLSEWPNLILGLHLIGNFTPPLAELS